MNEYDDIEAQFAGAQPPAASPSPSVYDDIERDFTAARAAQAQAVNANAQLGDADRLARAEMVGRELGLAGAVVATDLPVYEQRLALAKSSDLLAKSPALQQWMIANSDKAVLAKDDFERLSWLEQKIHSAQSGFDAAWMSGEKGYLAFKRETGDASPEDLAQHAALSKALAGQHAPSGVGNWVAHTAGSIGGMLADAYVRAGMQAGLAGAGAGAAAGGIAGAIGGPLAPATVPAGAGAGAAIGFTAGTTAGTAARFFESAYGNTLDGLRQITDSNGNRLDEWSVQGAAILSGVVNAALMGGIGNSAAQAAKSMMEQGLREAVERPTMAAALATFGRNMVGGVANGQVTLGAMAKGARDGLLLEGTNVLGEQVARLVSNGDFATVLDDPAQRQQAFDRILQSALEMSVAVGAMHAVPAGVNLVVDGARARRAGRDAQFVADLADGAAASALRGRSPDAFRDFIAGQTDGTPVEHLFIPANRVRELYQEMGVDPAAGDPLFGFVPDMPKQLEMAGQYGDVRVATADYAAHIAGTKLDQALRQDLRVGEGGITLREAAEFQARVEEIYQSRAEEWRRQVESETAAHSPAEAVFNDVFHQLRAVDVAPAEAEAMARLQAAHYETWAEQFLRSGDDRHDAWTLYQKAQTRYVRHLPESLRTYDVDALIASRAGDGPHGPDLLSRPATSLDALIDDMRDGRQAAQTAGPTLAQWISRRGGVADPGGELVSMGADRWHVGRHFSRKLVRKDVGADGQYHPDAVARAAWEQGFFPELQGERPTPDILFEALRDELSGNPRHADLTARLDDDGRVQARADLERALNELGLDLHAGPGRDNRYVKEALARWSGGDGTGGRELAQAMRPVRSLTGEEIAAKDADLPTLRAAARDWYQSELRGKSVVNQGSGKTIEFRSAKKAFATSANPDKLRVFPALLDLMRDGQLGERQPPDPARDKGQNIKGYYWLTGAVELGGKVHQVGVMIREDNIGNLYYNHNLMNEEASLPRNSVTPHKAGTGTKGNEASYDQKVAPDVDGINLTFEQGGAQKRGSIQLPPGGYGTGPHVINLFQAKNRSTLFHETAHLWLEELIHHAADPDGPALFRQDLDTLNRWLGVDHAGQIADLHHEKFARAFEAYLMEGKAPSVALENVFAKVRAWLVNLYARLVRGEPGSPAAALAGLSREAGFSVDLTPEIRAVMDRMLATDEQIQTAREAQGLRQMFKTAEDAGMSPAEFERYSTLAQQARDRAVLQAQAKAIAELEREKQAWWKTEAAALRREVASEVDARPDILALHYFRTGTLLNGRDPGPTRLRLSERALVDMMGAGILRDLPSSFVKVSTRAGGLHPDVMADMFGFRSGEEMVKALVQLKLQEDQLRGAGDQRSVRAYLADTITHDRMVERHGDILRDGTIVDEALAAVHNDAQAQVLASEVAVLRRLAQDSGRAQGRADTQPALGAAKARTAWDVAEARLLAEWRLGEERERGNQRVAAERDRTDAARQRLADERMARRWDAAERNTAQAKTRDALHLGAAGLKALRAAARQLVAETKVADLNLNAFARASAKAARAAEKAAVAHDFETAARAKEQQLLNHALFMEAKTAKAELDRAVGKMRKLAATDVNPRLDYDTLDQVHGLLERFGFRTPPRRETGERPTLDAFLAEQEALGETVAIADDLRLGTLSVPYDQLTVADLRVLADAVDNLVAMGRRQRQVELDGIKVDVDQAVANLSEAAEPWAKGAPDPSRLMSEQEKRGVNLLGIKAAMTRVEHWARMMDLGNPNGPFTRLIFRPVVSAVYRYREHKTAILKDLLAILEPRKQALLGSGKIAAPELGRDTVFENKGQLLHAILHTGNESNLTKLLLGRKWGEQRADGTLDTTRWDAFVARLIGEGRLTKADYDTAQAIWDMLETTKKPTQDAHRKMYGHPFAEIEAKPLTTPWGSYRGGYVPAIADRLQQDAGQRRADRDALSEMAGSSMFPTTGRGFTKSRTENYHAPLELNLMLIPRHVDSVLRFTHLQPTIQAVARIVTNRAFQSMMAAVDPAAVPGLLLPWLQRTARQSVVTPATGPDGRAVSRLFRLARARAGIQAMAGNLVNAIQQVTGLTVAMTEVPPSAMLRALVGYVRAPGEVAADARDRSALMRDRMDNSMQHAMAEIDSIITAPGGLAKARQMGERYGYFAQVIAQNIVDTVVWRGAYDQAVAKGVAETEAVFHADSVVRRTQGSFAPEDAAKVETGTPFARMFTMFYSYFNTQVNHLHTEAAIAIKRDGWGGAAGKLFHLYAFAFMLPAVAAEAIARTARDDWDQEDDGILDDLVETFLGAQFRYLTAFIPGGQVITAAVNTWNDKPYDDRISLSPVVNTVETGIKAPREIWRAMTGDGKSSRAIKDGLTLLGLLSGLPLGQLGKPLGYAADVAEGHQAGETVGDVLQGVLTGQDGTARR